VGMLKGFVYGEVLEFQVWDKDVFPKQDDFLGRLVLNSADFFPQGLQGDLRLTESKSQDATLSLRIEVFPDTTTGAATTDTSIHAPSQVVSGGHMGMAAGAMGMAAGAGLIHEMGGQMQEPVTTYGAPPMTDGAPPSTLPGMSPITYEAPSMYGVDPTVHGSQQPLTYGAPSPPMTYHAATPTPMSTTNTMTYGAPPSSGLPTEESTIPVSTAIVYTVTKHQPVECSADEFKKGHGALVHVTGFRHQGLGQPQQEVHHNCPTCHQPVEQPIEEGKRKKKGKLSIKKKSKACC